MKPIILFIACFMIISCSPTEDNSQKEQQTSSENFIDQEYSYNLENLTEECLLNSQIACTIENAVKCVINPKLTMCEALGLPSFVFLDDESLKRPTEQSFKITKLKPLTNGMLEVYTLGKCNGNLFGLCNGNIIYVLKHKDDNSWKIYDMYAIE